MASPNIYPNGAGGTTGDPLATLPNLALSGQIWYVSSVSGVDAVSPKGLDRIAPLATVQQAITNSAIGDVIVLLSGHTQTITTTITISKARLQIVSEGTGNNRATFTGSLAGPIFSILTSEVLFGNILFNASLLGSLSRISVQGGNFRVRGCQFNCGANDTVAAIELAAGGDFATIQSTTFTNVSTNTLSQPGAGVRALVALFGLTLDNVTFDGGTVGWSARLALNIGATIQSLFATNIDLLNDSDVFVAGGSGYIFNVRNKSGSARLTMA